MCTYNGALYLKEQLESILLQTVTPDELVISDDGSSDGTLELAEHIIRRLQEREPRLANLQLRVQSNSPGLGVTANFASAIALATQDVIFLSDQDDVWMPNKIEVLLDYFERDSALLLVHTNALLVDHNARSLGLTLFDALRVSQSELDRIHAGDAFGVLMRRNLVTGATTAVLRSLAQSVTEYPQGWLHDEFLGLVAATRGRVDVIESNLIQYRQHGRNQIGASRPGLKQLVGRVLYPGKERNQTLFARAQALRESQVLNSEDIEESCRDLIAENYNHELLRSHFEVNRIPRMRQVISEIGTGRYRTVGLGLPDIVRDIFQPLQ
jgi:glycosyltransferase involved in cell wall biosynthesis